MSKITLVRLDTDASIVTVPVGNTVIGRGSFLECQDKKVSRNHALLKLDEDGVLTLTPTHTNPCFYKEGGFKLTVTLPKDVPIKLCSGDQFSLLLKSYWFKVVSKNGTTSDENNTKQSNNPKSDKVKSEHSDDNLVKSENVQGDGSRLTVQSEVGSTGGDVDLCDAGDSTETSAPGPTKKVDADEVSKRERKIPDWMQDTASDQNQTQNSPEKAKGQQKRKIQDEEAEQKQVAAKVHKKAPYKAKAGKSSEDKDIPQAQNDAGSKAGDVHALSDEEVEAKKQDNEDKSNGGPNIKVQNRAKCQYAGKCYRSNPAHRQQFSHPGDSDFESDSDEDKPECQYGTSCYRKNPQHRKDYKHTASPKQQGPKAPKKQKTTNAGKGSSEEDDYDLDDSFMNDGSSDDYLPTDSDTDEVREEEEGEEEEDNKRMLKEAKKFTRKTRKNQ